MTILFYKINGIGVQKEKNTFSRANKFEPTCYCCGEIGHRKPECKFKTFTCGLVTKKVILKIFAKVKPKTKIVKNFTS